MPQLLTLNGPQIPTLPFLFSVTPECDALHAEEPLKGRASGLTKDNEISDDQCKCQQHWPSTQRVGYITIAERCPWFAGSVRRIVSMAEYFDTAYMQTGTARKKSRIPARLRFHIGWGGS